MVPRSEPEVCCQGVHGANTQGITMYVELFMDVKFKNTTNSIVVLAAEVSTKQTHKELHCIFNRSWMWSSKTKGIPKFFLEAFTEHFHLGLLAILNLTWM